MAARLQRRNSSKPRGTAVLAVLALLAGLFGWSLQLPAQALAGSTFDATDGNEEVDGSETDWFSPGLPNLVTVEDSPSGSGDSSLNGNEDNVEPVYTNGNIQNNKADLLKIRVAHEKVLTKHFLYLAWNRVDDPNGNVAFDFELNRLAQPPLPDVGQKWILNRSAGDLLITFELVQGGTAPVLSLRRWLTGAGTCESGGSKPCWSKATLLSALTDPAAEGSVKVLPSGDIPFGEMAVDLGLAGIFTPGECTSFASVYAKSRASGSSFVSQISDLVPPIETTVSNCGGITVTKAVTGPTLAGDATSFDFTVSCPTVDLDPTTAGVQSTITFSLVDGKSKTVPNIPPTATCTVTETDPSPDNFTTTYQVTGDADPSAGREATIRDVPLAGKSVTFTNARQTGGLTVTKTSTGGVGTFLFSVDCDDGTTRTDGDKISITTATSGTPVTSAAITGIPTGAVCTVTEDENSLYSTVVDPSDGERTIDTTTQTVSFTNVRKTGSLTITKATTGGDGSFSFAVDCTDDAFDHASIVVTTTAGAGSSTPISGIPTGTECTVTETVPAGWAAVGGTIRDVTIDADGETAAFENRKLVPGINVTKVASAPVVHDGTAVTYTYVVTNTGETPLSDVTVVDDKCATVTGPAAGNDVGSDGVLGLTETWTYTCTSTLTATTTNVVTATGTGPLDDDVSDTASATVTVIKPAIAIDKAPSATSVEPGTTVVYTYTVTNPGDVPLTAVTVTDDKCSPVTLARGDTNGDGVLQVTETWVFTCSQVQTGSIDTLTNVGTARGIDPLGAAVTASETVTVAVVAPLVLTQPAAPAPAPEPAPAPVAVAPVTLPRTGIDAGGWMQLGGSLLLLGLALVLTSRSRRRA